MRGQTLDQKTALSIIERLALFKRFSPAEKMRIAALHNHFCVFRKGEDIVREGSIEPFFFILLSGRVHVTKKGGSTHLATLEPEDFFGEISFVTSTPRTASVSAEEESIAMRVDESMMEKLDAETREKIKDKIIEKLAERLDRMNALFADSW